MGADCDRDCRLTRWCPRQLTGHSLRRALFALLAGMTLAAGSACDLLPDSQFPPGGGQRINELPQYRLWWSLVEQCSLRRRRMDVTWYSTDGMLIKYDQVWALGAYRSWPDRIALAFPERGPTARHEMLHAILEQGGHPLEKFAGDCDGFVNFDPPDGYGGTEEEQRNAVQMRADSALLVSTTTVPAVPQLSQFGGHFAIILTVTNASKRNVWVPITLPIFAQYTDSLGLLDANFNRPPSRVFFRAGQTRRVLLDAQIRKTGNYVLTASYGRARAKPVTLQLEK